MCVLAMSLLAFPFGMEITKKAWKNVLILGSVFLFFVVVDVVVIYMTIES